MVQPDLGQVASTFGKQFSQFCRQLWYISSLQQQQPAFRGETYSTYLWHVSIRGHICARETYSTYLYSNLLLQYVYQDILPEAWYRYPPPCHHSCVNCSGWPFKGNLLLTTANLAGCSFLVIAEFKTSKHNNCTAVFIIKNQMFGLCFFSHKSNPASKVFPESYSQEWFWIRWFIWIKSSHSSE
jgi:hypothetical protein